MPASDAWRRITASTCARCRRAAGRIGQIRPIEVADQLERLHETELSHDVAPHPRVAVAVKADRHVGPRGAQLADAAVLGPEVVAPVADAVRLVDDQAREAELQEPLEEARLHKTLGRDEQQLQRTAREPALTSRLAAVLRARQHRSRNALSTSPAIWSRISEISGLTTQLRPSRSSAGAW
jgi:AraC-like DNA-binding protein